MDIINKLQQYGEANGLTQSDLAQKLGVSFQTVNRWFNGHVVPNTRQAKKINQLLATESKKTKSPLDQLFNVTPEISTTVPRFRFKDPTQERIFKALALIGPGPQQFFKDACRLMQAAYEGVGFESTVNLVAHLIREIDSSLRNVLIPYDERNKTGSSEELDSRKIQITSIAKTMGLEVESPEFVAWLDYKPHSYAHRNALDKARPIDHDFINFWELTQKIFDLILKNSEKQFLTFFERVDKVVQIKEPENKVVKDLKKSIPQNEVVYGYLFSHLEKQSLKWLPLLHDNGFFSSPPNAIIHEDSGTIQFPKWPAIDYLRAVAQRPSLEKETQKYIFEVISQIPPTDNIWIHDSLLEILIKLPADLSARFVPQAIDWISRKFSTPFLPERIGNLITHLTSGKEIEGANKLVSSFLKLTQEEHKSSSYMRFSVRSRFDTWHYSEFLKKYVVPWGIAAGISGLRIVSDILRDALRLEGNKQDNEGPEDSSHVWKTDLDKSDFDDRDIKRSLAEAVKKISEGIVSSDQSQTVKVAEVLESYDWNIFYRITIKLLAKFPDADIPLVKDILLDKELFNAYWVENEFWELADTALKYLPKDDQKTFLNWIALGPNGKELRDLSPEEIESYRKRWQRNRLGWIESQLPPDWKKTFASLLKEFGPPAERQQFEMSSWVGPTSPKSKDDLKELTVHEIVQFLKEWKKPEGHWIDSPEGLGRVLESVIEENPEKFIKDALVFRGLNPTYVRAFFQGTKAGLKNLKEQIDWKPVLDLAVWVLEQPRDSGKKQTDFEEDVNWISARRSIANFLETILPAERGFLFDSRSDVWNVLKELLKDPEPSADAVMDDPLTESINTVRGEAMHALIRFGLWIRRTFEKNGELAKVAEGLNSMPEVKESLEFHLDVTQEPSLAIRAVYGQWLPWLHLIDPQWTKNNLNKILPRDLRSKKFREAAWSTYLKFCSPYNDVLPLLKDDYDYAIKQLDTSAVKIDRAEEGLSNHIMTFAARGLLDFESPNETVSQFWKKASPQLRQDAIEHLGRMLYNTKETLPEDIQQRFMKIWEVRFSQINASSSSKEVGKFGWWFASGKLPSEWSLDQIIAILDLNAKIESSTFVLEQMVALVKEHPLKAVIATEKMLRADHEARGWLIRTASEETRKILSVALAQINEEIKKAAKGLINSLVAWGYPDFRDLL